MSRIGIKPVEVIEGVTINIDGKNLTAKGSKGELNLTINDAVIVTLEESQVIVKPANDTQEAHALWGLSRSLIQNMVEGVSKGYTKELELQGVGYRAQVQGKVLKMNLGFSHDINYNIPEGIEIKTPKPTEITISGIDKQKVGQVAAEIRKYRKPEPYKGKGVRYVGEYIRRKEGKKK
jgi:large subunit ribosomal protein L6